MPRRLAGPKNSWVFGIRLRASHVLGAHITQRYDRPPSPLFPSPFLGTFLYGPARSLPLKGKPLPFRSKEERSFSFSSRFQRLLPKRGFPDCGKVFPPPPLLPFLTCAFDWRASSAEKAEKAEAMNRFFGWDHEGNKKVSQKFRDKEEERRKKKQKHARN